MSVCESEGYERASESDCGSQQVVMCVRDGGRERGIEQSHTRAEAMRERSGH